MNLNFILLPCLFSASAISAQLAITPGAEFFATGDIQLTLYNSDLINNGTFSSEFNSFAFSGNMNSTISGNEAVRFFQLEINKPGNSTVTLQKPINIIDRILFTSGLLNLNSYNADLETTGLLVGEREDSRVIGTGGGQLLFRTVLNEPLNANPGNLGAVITSSENLGAILIKRGHQSLNGNGLTESIFRYYDITPTNNINLNAEISLNYFDAELNANFENTLSIFKSEDFTNWSDLSFTSRNTVNNQVTRNGVNSFSRLTLSSSNSPLPVHFILFNAKCENNKVEMIWKTAQEQNSTRFDVESSVDGLRWTVIGSVLAAGNSNIEKTYSFVDNNSMPNSFYRIAEYDLNGRTQYTSMIRSSCNTSDVFNLWPNPSHDIVNLKIVSRNESAASIMLFDSKGALVKMQRAIVLRGSNQFFIDIRLLANGIYSLSVDWNNGKTKKTIQVVKQ